MKNLTIKKWALVLAVAGGAAFAQAQNMPASVPQLSGPAAEVLKLQQANVGDDTIQAYVANSRASFNLNADQIIYLKQQGVSTAALNGMLNQPRNYPAPAEAPQPVTAAVTAPAPDASSTTVVQPTTTVVQTVPATTYYYSDPYYYPAYYGWGGYPAVSFSWGWGGGWHGGGWGGGWHGGSAWHGGGSSWHGGSGFGGHSGGFGGHGGGGHR